MQKSKKLLAVLLAAVLMLTGLSLVTAKPSDASIAKFHGYLAEVNAKSDAEA